MTLAREREASGDAFVEPPESGIVDYPVSELSELRQALRVLRSQLRVEQALRENDSTLQSVIDSLPAMIWYKDTSNRVVRVNRAAAEFEGVPLDALVGRSSWDLYPREQADAYFRDDQEVIASGEPKLGILEGHRAPGSGTETWLEVSKVPVKDAANQVIGVVAMAVDVTENRRLQQGLQQSQRMESLSVLAGGLAHDFNNLLSGIFGWVEAACHTPDCGPQARQRLQQTLGAFRRARNLTDQLITFSKGGSPVLTSVGLAELLEETLPFLLSGSNVEVHSEVTPGTSPCFVDRQQLVQVLDNLLLNARQAMPNGGSLYISARNEDDPRQLPPLLPPAQYVRIDVTDTGPGIPPEVLPRVFEPFFTTKASGTGLGLAMSWSIIKRHGGHIEVTSNPSGGATFTVWLPASSHQVPSRYSTAPPAASLSPGRALIMDDEPALRELSAFMLEEMGWQVDRAADGDAALRLARSAACEGLSYEMAILDLTVKGGRGGREIVAELNGLMPSMMTLATSGYSDDPAMEQPRQFGFWAALPKPYLQQDLLKVLQKLQREQPSP